MRTIDLRSDTVTLPTPEMRKAMFEAEVGDDVFGEDPTVNRLEKMAAAKMGKEAALFTTSGTQSNIVSILTNTHHGEEIILGDNAHIFWYEVGGASAIAGVVMRTVTNGKNGRLELDDVKNAIRSKDVHFPTTTLLCLENTHNRCGGAALPPDYIREVCALAHANGLKVYMDGARLFNASVALGVPVKSLTENVDSVSFCLSKGLSAPAGSLLCGTAEFIARARKFRKMLGGGMRQAGILAAAGVVALETMVPRLAEDHANAKKLAQGLAKIPGLIVTQEETQTNMVMLTVAPGITERDFTAALLNSGVKLSSREGNKFRAVTNRGVSSEDIDDAVRRIEKIMDVLVHN
jgi:threonine aldolase